MVGERLAHYRLAEEIGAGGIGVVWRAVDTRLDREVAIKMLHESLTSDEARVASIVREARNVAALHHPNILTVHSIEEHAGVRFIVMELVEGQTLDTIIPHGGLEIGRFFHIALQLTDAIAAAHERCVIHGDLKPGNIMIGPDDHVTVLDFGLSRTCRPVDLPGTTADPTQSMPSLSRVAGTVRYMAPEQLRGEAAGTRADLFSLGVVLYEMAAGRRPFAGDSAPASIAALLRDEPLPLGEARRGLPRRLGRIIRRALDKDPERRIGYAADLHAELGQLRDDVGRDVSFGDIRAVAVLPLDDLSGDPEQAFFADGMTDALINTLGRISALKVISRTSVMRYRGVSRPLPEVARELGVDAVVEGSVLRAGHRVRITAQLIDAVLDRLLWADCYEHDLDDVFALQARAARAIAERIAIELTPQEHEHLSRTRRVDPRVHEAYLRGRHFWHKRTTSSVRQGLAYFERAVALDPSYAPAHAGIADSYIVDGGRYLGVAPDVAYGRARSAAERAMELDDSLAESHTSLAAVMTDYDWDWEGADREYRRAIELNPSYATAHSWFAEQLSRMGRHDEAVAEARLARRLDPLSLVSSMIVAWILYFARRFDESIAQARQTLELDESYATAHRILGWAYEETGRYEEAIAAHRRAGELTDGQPNFFGQLGRAYALCGRRDEAESIVERLREAASRTYVSSLDVAIIHAALGSRDLALACLERAFEERADQLPYLGVNPRLDVLRSEPRFLAVLERMGLAGDTRPT